MEKRFLRYSVENATFMLCEGEVAAHNLYGKVEVITEEQYVKAKAVLESYAGLFQVMPVMVMKSNKVMDSFDEKSLIGYEVGNTKYLWAWRDHLGNIWAETTFQGAPIPTRKELIN